MKLPWSRIRKLRSRHEPILEGDVAAWPPRGLQLRLSNRPIAYFDERKVRDDRARPVITVVENNALLSEEDSEFLSIKPEILEAIAVSPAGEAWQEGEVAGVRITWTETASRLQDIGIDSYHVYRNYEPNDLGGWEQIGSVGGRETTYMDRS